MADMTLSDLILNKKRPADQLVGGTRALLGQGLGMGWGDEAEAWLRSKLGEGKYEDLVQKIRSEYGQYAQEHPFTSGALEFTGGVAPGVAAMFVPGGQGIGAAQAARSAGALAKLASSPLARSALAGTVTGGVTGAGVATEGERGTGAAGGATLGGILGAGTPVAMRTAGGAANWAAQRLLPTETRVEQAALNKMTGAMNESGVSPRDIIRRMASDRSMGVPSVVANVDTGLADLAEAVAQRTGRGARKVETTLNQQKLGARERAHQQLVQGLNPQDYYAQEQTMLDTLRKNANSVYEKAYAVGDVNDPIINQVLADPTFAKFFEKAKSIADKEALAAKVSGGDPSKFQLKQIYEPIYETDAATGSPILKGFNIKESPDVRTLDYIKRGIDATIDSGFRGEGMSTAEANALKELRNRFRDRLDLLVPEYKAARGQYAGDMEVLDALRSGMNDFSKMDHEQIIKAVSGMGAAEKDAFRTGVSRDLYGKIMNPSGNFNAAQRLIGSPEMQAKLQPLFDNPDQFKLFKAALERESQLYFQANKILGGSQTGKRMQMRSELENDSQVGNAVAQAVTGGWTSSLASLASRAIQSSSMTEKTASKLADMLMSKNPNEVAATVRLLEDFANKAPGKAKRAAAIEGGVATGATTSVFSPPQAPVSSNPEIEGDTSKMAPLEIEGPDIEADIEALRANPQ
jgi:hypothetical protein